MSDISGNRGEGGEGGASGNRASNMDGYSQSSRVVEYVVVEEG